jgi:hypothetical protein
LGRDQCQDDVRRAIGKAQSEMGDLGLKLSDVHTVAMVFPAASASEPTVALTGAFDQSDLLARLANELENQSDIGEVQRL